MSFKVNYTKLLFSVSIVFFILFASVFYFQWRNLNENIKEIKAQNNENYENILHKKDFGPFQIEYKNLNGKQVLIEPQEIEKINTHIKILTEEVFKESNKAENIIDKDIDRLNLYMAVGIGFMTLFGIFVPVLVNLLSTQDLREKISEILKKFKKVEEQEPKINKAIKDSESAIENSTNALSETSKFSDLSNKINKIEEKTEKVLPEINNLALQNTISRFFNISPIVLTNAIRVQNFQDFVNLLIPIKNGFIECNKNGSHTIKNNETFKRTIEDFILFLKTESFRFQSIFNSKLENQKFDSLITLLANLKNSTVEKEAENYEKLIKHIEEIIELFKNKNVKNKPTT